MLTISELMRVLDALEDKMSCEGQTWGERRTLLNTRADFSVHLMCLSWPFPI